MISFRPSGRMGNYLFEISHCIALALKNNQEFSAPNQTIDPFWNPLYLQHLVNPKYIQGREDILINENGMQYQPIEWNDDWNDKQVVLNGYWQSEKYFKEYRNEILYLFGFPYEKRDGVVSIHVRRGDYLHLRMKHPEVPKQWYEEAMSMFPNYKFKFFSDEISWCKQEFGNRNDCEFSENNDIEKDLIEMSWSEHNICSASTFAWWSMWLNRNPDKKVIFPKLWFVEGWENMDTSDVVPEWCIKL